MDSSLTPLEENTLFERFRREPDRMNGKANPCTPGWLFVLPWSIRYASGGVNQVVRSLILEFRRGGTFNPHLIAGSEGSQARSPREEDLIEPLHVDLWSPIDHDHPFRAWISFLYRLPVRCGAVLKIIKACNIRVINPHYPGLACLVFLILKRTGLFKGKIVLSFHLSDIRHALSTKGIERTLWRILLRGADHIVVVSRHSEANILEIDSCVAEKVVTIRNGVDLALFSSGGAAGRHTDPHQEKSIVSVGAFIPRKGHDTLVQAFSHLLEFVPNARLTIVGGDGPGAESLRQLVDSLELAEKIRICTDVPHEQIPAFLSQAQLFVLASHGEAHHLAVIEAGAVGLPIVCAEGPWSRELISDGVTGRLVASGDEHALASTMADLLVHEREAQQMAARFHEYVTENLTWEQTYKKYLQLSCEDANGAGALECQLLLGPRG